MERRGCAKGLPWMYFAHPGVNVRVSLWGCLVFLRGYQRGFPAGVGWLLVLRLGDGLTVVSWGF